MKFWTITNLANQEGRSRFQRPIKVDICVYC